MTSKTRLQILLSLIGILGLLASLALAAGTMRTTEATWQDTVAGKAEFRAAATTGQNYARAVSVYGSIQRPWTSDTIGPGRSDAQPGSPLRAAPMRHSDDGLLGVQPLLLEGSTCATVEGDSATECAAPDALPAGSSYAASTVSRIGLWAAGLEGIENLSYGAKGQKPIKATATCRPGKDGQTAITMDGPLYIRSDTPLHLPPANHQTFVDRPVATRNVTGLLQNHQSSGPGWAKAELRLYAKSTIVASGWTLHAVLASAECTLAGSAPADLTRPTTGSVPANLPEAPNRPAGMTFQRAAALQPITDMVEGAPDDEAEVVEEEEETGDADDTVVDQDEAALPSLPDVDETATSEAAATTTPSTKASATSTFSPTTSVPADLTSGTTETSAPGTSTTVPVTSAPAATSPATTETVTVEPDVPGSIVPELAEPTTPTETTHAPQQARDVTVGRWFTVTGPDGAELGTAKIEDIVRTPDCGVRLTLHLTTSDETGPARWASVAPDDFAEVRPGGTTRDARRLNADCAESAHSRTTSLSPGRDYEIVIAFQLSDPAPRAMLRPEGTAGWIFDLPAPTLPTTNPTPLTTTVASAPETTVQTPDA